MNEDLDLSENVDIKKALEEFEEKSKVEQAQKAPEVLQASKAPKMTALVMKWFSLEQRQAEYVLLGFAVLAILFSFIILSFVFELSIIIGAFIAGVSLANSPYKLELESRTSSLRDFFSILFFVALGMQIVLDGVFERMNLFLFLIAGALIIKPIITMILLRVGAYRTRTSFITAISLAQLSEFSLIIGMIGFNLGILDESILSNVVLATIISMSLTTYFIDYQEKIYHFFRRPLGLLKFLPVEENLIYNTSNGKKTILLLGAHRMGSIILKDLLEKHKKELLVLDYNPEIINSLIKKKVSCIYGDVSSPDLIESIDASSLKLIISTVPNFDGSSLLINKIKEKNPHVKVFLTAANIPEAFELYEKGADYVILPKFDAGVKISHIIHNNLHKIKDIKKNQMDKLKDTHNFLTKI